jgi:hypothetical protein
MVISTFRRLPDFLIRKTSDLLMNKMYYPKAALVTVIE